MLSPHDTATGADARSGIAQVYHIHRIGFQLRKPHPESEVMTPEEIGQRISAVYIGNGSHHHAVKAIAEAITAARSEALEEAARIVEDTEYEPQSVYSAIRQAAEAIRELAKCQP